MPRKKVTTTDVEEVKVDPSPPIQKSPTDENLLTINDRERGITLADSDEIKWNYIMITREQDRRRVEAEQKLALTPEQIFEAGLLYLGVC